MLDNQHVYFIIKYEDDKFKKHYRLVDYDGKAITDSYKGSFGIIPLARDVASKIEKGELEERLIFDKSLAICSKNPKTVNLIPINSLEYEFFHMFVRANLREKGKLRDKK